MHKGFSLIELLIVVTIIGILATISYPSYHEYITRAHRIDGQSALLDLACRMEIYFAEHETYQTATIGTGNTTDVLSRQQSPEGWYTMSVTEASETMYRLQATPTSAKDPRCGSLTLTSLGIKGVTGATTASVSQCW